MNWKQRLVILLGTIAITISLLSSTEIGSISFVLHIFVIAGGLYLFFKGHSEQERFPKSVWIVGSVLIFIYVGILVTQMIMSSNSNAQRQDLSEYSAKELTHAKETDYERAKRLFAIEESLSDKELIDMAKRRGLMTPVQADSLKKIIDERPTP
ncbi:MAG: hypothetical protein ACREBV_05250 [Candidatus Zixiibacteriota bacterium]